MAAPSRRDELRAGGGDAIQARTPFVCSPDDLDDPRPAADDRIGVVMTDPARLPVAFGAIAVAVEGDERCAAVDRLAAGMPRTASAMR